MEQIKRRHEAIEDILEFIDSPCWPGLSRESQQRWCHQLSELWASLQELETRGEDKMNEIAPQPEEGVKQ